MDHHVAFYNSQNPQETLRYKNSIWYFNNISVISWKSGLLRKPEYPEKTADLP